MFVTAQKLWGHLAARRKKQLVLLAGLMLFGGMAEAISLGLVVSFLTAMAAPEKILASPLAPSLIGFLNWASANLGMKFNAIHLVQTYSVLVFAALFILAALWSGGVRLALVWANVRLASATGTELGLSVYRHTLYQPYSVHLSRNSSSLISGLTAKVGLVTTTLTLWLTILTSLVIILFLCGTLFWISPWITFGAGTILGLSYWLMSFLSAQKLARCSAVISREQNSIVKALQEGLGGIRDILLDGTQLIYCEIYRKADTVLRRSYADINVIGQSPRFIMESVGMVVFAMLAFALSKGPEGLVSALPTLGALALGVQRLLPALQQGYAAWSTISAYEEPNKEIVELLNQPLPSWLATDVPKPIRFENKLRFASVSFRYSKTGPFVLRALSFGIKKGSRVGFVGKTGVGKSTCLDLLMGLLEPSVGKIYIDDEPLGPKNLRAWQRNIAHVPQSIYLSDGSLAENIAFGVPQGEIDMRRVEKVARMAQIADFIESSPQKYQAVVGERGIRLSGGQRQRIGIARALYKQAQVLILDEATSALDQKTEEDVMKSIHTLNPSITILVVAHRKSSLRKCQQTIRLK